jgi:EAL domain-containing protein (putative c-di-GMP-specific phosphodiesterase class I)
MLVVRHCGDYVPKSWNRWGHPFHPDSRHLWRFPLPANMDSTEFLHSLVTETPPDVLQECMGIWLNSGPEDWLALEALDDLEPLTVMHARLRHPWIMDNFQPLLRTSFQAIVALGEAPSLFGYHLTCGLHPPQQPPLSTNETFRIARAARRSHVLDQTCQLCSLMAKAESIPRGVPVVIHALPASLLASDPLRHPSFHYLERLQIEPRDVIIELAERCRSEDIEVLVAHCETLRAMGFRIALGDLGIGDGQMQMLIRLRPDVMRIEAGVVAEAREWSPARRIIRTLVEIAADLGVMTLADGIDYPADLDLCRRLSVDLVQGKCIGSIASAPIVPEFSNLSIHRGSMVYGQANEVADA